jgi:hypothetical protein
MLMDTEFYGIPLNFSLVMSAWGQVDEPKISTEHLTLSQTVYFKYAKVSSAVKSHVLAF